MFWLGILICRLGCSWLSAKFKAIQILFIGTVIGTILYCLGLLTVNEYTVIAGFTCAGLFAGATIPLCITIGYENNPQIQATVSMVLYLAISVGQIVFPWLMGIIGDIIGLQGAMLFNVLLLGITAVLAIVLNNNIKSKKEETYLQ